MAQNLNIVKFDEEEPIYFNKDNSYWATQLKKGDPFNTNFKLQIVVGDISETKDIFIGVRYAGNYYILGIAKGVERNKALTFKWGDKVPTIDEFFGWFGEEIKESKNYDLAWITGYVTEYADNTVSGVITDMLETSIYVEVKTINYLPILIAGALIVGVAAIVMGSKKK